MAPPYHLIWLHGLGQDGQERWAGQFQAQLCDILASEEGQEPIEVLVSFPQASASAVKAFGGEVKPNWFAMPSIPLTQVAIDQEMSADPKLQESVAQIETAIEELLAREGCSPEQVLLGGFSQGGALSLLVGLRSRHRLGGVICAAGWFVHDGRIAAAEERGAGTELPLLWLHGTADRPIPLALQASGVAALEASGMGCVQAEAVEGMGHDLRDEDFVHLRSWLREAVAARG